MQGIFADFLPSDWLLGANALIAILLLALVEFVVLAWLFWRTGAMRGLWFRSPLLLFACGLLMFPLLAFINLNIILKSIPWAYAHALGTELRVQATLLSHYKRSRRNCDYQLRGSVLNYDSAQLCIDKARYLISPEKQVQAVIIGKQSVLGFAIKEIVVSHDKRVRHKELSR